MSIQRRSSQSGFSIVEVLLASSLGIIGALAVSELAAGNLKMNKHVETVGKLNDFANEIRLTLSKEDLCSQSVTNTGALPTKTFDTAAATLATTDIQIDELKIGSSNRLLIKKNDPLPSIKNLKVTQLGIADLADISPTASPGSMFSGNMHVAFRKTDGAFGVQTFERKYPIVLKTTLAGSTATIIGCSMGSTTLTSADLNLICTNSGGVFQNNKCQYPMATPTNSTECAKILGAGYAWNGSGCAPTAATACTSLGYSWNGSSCSPPAQAATTTCASLGAGYSWNGVTCVPPAPATRAPASQSDCSIFGAGYVWNGSACLPPSTAKPTSTGGSVGQWQLVNTAADPSTPLCATSQVSQGSLCAPVDSVCNTRQLYTDRLMSFRCVMQDDQGGGAK